jgi:hypothetical protein
MLQSVPCFDIIPPLSKTFNSFQWHYYVQPRWEDLLLPVQPPYYHCRDDKFLHMNPGKNPLSPPDVRRNVCYAYQITENTGRLPTEQPKAFDSKQSKIERTTSDWAKRIRFENNWYTTVTKFTISDLVRDCIIMGEFTSAVVHWMI